jgi:hypothetical protein
LLGRQNVPGHRWGEPTSKEEGQTEPLRPHVPKVVLDGACGGPNLQVDSPLALGPALLCVLNGSFPLGNADPLYCPRPCLVSFPATRSCRASNPKSDRIGYAL